jgi:steroid 5-alpha reductase family enzyme
MFDLGIYVSGLGAALLMGFGAWLLSLPRRSVSHVDSFWSLFFLLMAGVYAVMAPTLAARAYLMLALVAVWAIRLSIHITWRNWGEGEDRRYQRIRRENEPGFAWKSLYLVFGVQAFLAWVISLPLLAAILGTAPLGALDFAGAALWLVGFAFQAVGDQQLARFKARPGSEGQVMDRGLWRYTRHPNYFGEACMWWGFFLIAASAGGWWAFVSPVVMTFLLLRVSGVTLLERDIAERRPGYRDYVRRTNAFFPGPPRKVSR